MLSSEPGCTVAKPPETRAGKLQINLLSGKVHEFPDQRPHYVPRQEHSP